MTLYGSFSILLTALAIGIPIYFVIFRRRFWFAALVSWILLVASQQFAVLASPSSDTTTVGLTLFTGWLLSIRLFLNRVGLLPAWTCRPDFVAGGDGKQGEQAGASDGDKPPC
jgi:hypothetical protein